MARMTVGERRGLLVDAAIAVMKREGVARATTRAIVAEAGMQIGVFHYCFRSKEELIVEVMRTIGDRSFEAVGDVLSQSTDPAELIHLATRAYWSHLEANPEEHLLTYELTQHALRQPGQEASADAQYENYFVGMEAFLGAVAELGGCTWSTPVEVLARFALAAIDGITYQWLVNRDETMAELLLDQLVAWLCADAGVTAGVRSS